MYKPEEIRELLKKDGGEQISEDDYKSLDNALRIYEAEKISNTFAICTRHKFRDLSFFLKHVLRVLGESHITVLILPQNEFNILLFGSSKTFGVQFVFFSDEKDIEERKNLLESNVTQKVYVLSENIFREDDEKKIQTSKWGEYVVMSADRVICHGRFQKLVETIKGPDTIVCYLLPGVSPFRLNVITDIITIGKLTNEPKLSDKTFIENYPFSKIKEIFDTKCIRDGVQHHPMLNYVQVVNVDDKLEKVISKIVNTFFDKILPNFQSTRALIDLNKDYMIVRKKSSWNKVDFVWRERINDLWEFLQAWDKMLFDINGGLEMMKVILKHNKTFQDTIESARNELKEYTSLEAIVTIAETPKLKIKNIPKMTDKFFRIISTLLDFDQMRKLDTGKVLVVVPRKMLVEIEKTFKMFLLEMKTPDFIVFAGSDDKYPLLLAKVIAMEKKKVKNVLFVVDEDQFDNHMFADSFEFDEVHLFPIKYCYLPHLQQKAFGVCPKKANIMVYFGDTIMESTLATHIYKRKRFMYKLMVKHPGQWKRKFIAVVPLITIKNMPFFESNITQDSSYDSKGLTPLELLKCLSVYSTGNGILSDSGGRFVAHTSSSKSSGGLVLLKAVGFTKMIPDASGRVKKYIEGKLKITESDFVGMIKLIPAAWNLDESLIKTILSLILQYLKDSKLVMIARRFLFGKLKIYCVVIPQFKDDMSKVCKEIYKVIDERYFGEKKFKMSPKQAAVLYNEMLPRGSLKRMKMVGIDNFVHPDLLILLGLVSSSTKIGAEVFRSRLIDWYRIYGDYEETSETGMDAIVRDTINYITKRAPPGLEMPKFDPERKTVYF